ncbi:hypothetical protein DFH94DRAFT_689846 [Russula ochroleuca]|jgi:hypothetical protein|uniref:F-box domain-containing protein n=1 Tax=Russula ochroleuca TaxID=152965 RepID=A0A9P5N0G9_9AGAM|nr:hypothetical protein DFH94DRAFT_689846 [Russula ochroleuca]
MSIDMLPEEVLLAIFDCLADGPPYAEKRAIESWQSLVHVCRQWRRVVFGSPRRLNLRLVCTSRTPARDTLDVWPAFPLVILGNVFDTSGVNNIIAVLERSDRVCQIDLDFVPSSQLEKVSVAMQEPFPELTSLKLRSGDENDATVLVLPDSFLGGPAPRLRELWLSRIPLPGLPKLILSATHLVDLSLSDIPHSGFFSPEAMVAALSTLTSLEIFQLRFQSPQSRPHRASRRPPPLTRSVLPVLSQLIFEGVSEYLDDLAARIDTPRLERLYIDFFNQIVFDTPQLVQFICRAQMLKILEKARLTCSVDAARVMLSQQAPSYSPFIYVEVPCRELDWQISSLEQVFTLCLPPFSTLEDLYIDEDPDPDRKPDWQQDNIENSLWLELLNPFTTVKNLYISEEFVRRIVPALQELVGGRTTGLLPALQNVFLEGLQPSGSVQEGIGHFTAMRRATGHPVAVSRWDRDS